MLPTSYSLVLALCRMEIPEENTGVVLENLMYHGLITQIKKVLLN